MDTTSPIEFPYEFYYYEDANGETFEHGTQTDVFTNLQATLSFRTYPVSTRAKNISDYLTFFVQNQARNGRPCPLEDIWVVIIDMATCILAGHEWHDVLLEVLVNLTQNKGVVPGLPFKEGRDSIRNRWERLPGFDLQGYEKALHCDRRKGVSILQEEFSLESEAARRRNLASFTARFADLETQRNPGGWPYLFGIDDLRKGLEMTPQPASQRKPFSHLGADTDIWIACEWLIHTSPLIHVSMTAGQSLPQALKVKYGLGKLCPKHTPLVSTARWNFWETRIEDILAGGGLNSHTADHCSKALAAMKATESVYSADGW